jgi:hypothetical protein
MYLDLSELPHVFKIHPFWSQERLNLATFRRCDHFGDPEVPLAQAVQDLIVERMGRPTSGPIRLLTHLRYFGHCFNPASFYYCFDAADTRVETIIVEIHNTPWGERYCYVLPNEKNEHPLENWRRFQFDKAFHVSPFIGMNIHYDWRFQMPQQTVRVHMIDHENDKKLFDASLSLQRRVLDRWILSRVLFQYPLLTVKVVSMIYWQALRLWVKRAPYYPHPRNLSKQERQP